MTRHRDLPREATIQRNIEALLASIGVKCWRLNAGLTFRRGKPVRGLPQGTPDLVMLLREGRAVFVEVKTEEGTVRAEQQVMHDELLGLGYEVLVVHSIDDMEHGLVRLGVLQ